MRSLRLFYSDPFCTKGQVVIASRESQYKILHFHHGGLDKLAEIFEDWNLFAKMKDKVGKNIKCFFRVLQYCKPAFICLQEYFTGFDCAL